MKILIDARTTQDEIKYNGVGRYSRFIIEYLVRNNSDINFDLLMYDGFSTIDDLINENRDNLNIIRIGKFTDGKGWANIKYNLRMGLHIDINKGIKISKPDAFLSLYFWRGLPVFKVPTFVAIHDFALPFFNIYSTISPIHNTLRFIHYWYELLRLYYAKGIICDSEYTRHDVFKYLNKIKKEKVHTVYLGVEEDRADGSDFEKFLPSDWRKRKYLLYLGGGTTVNKNSKGVIDGYKEFLKQLMLKGIKKENAPYLVIAGKNFVKGFSKESDDLHRYIYENSLEKNIHFTGFYEDSIRWNLLDNCFAFIHLSLFEGFGFSVAEAMRAKVPVIAHNGTSYIEVVGKDGILVSGKDEKNVGNAIYKLYTDKEFAKEIARRGYSRSLEFDWNKCAKETFDIIKTSIK